MSFKKGFTLAEVLITLAIIGVIAAISVPSLIQKTNMAELKTSYIKDFAMLNQAAMNAAFANGGDLKGIINAGGVSQASNKVFLDAFANQLKVLKRCDWNCYDNTWHKSGAWYFVDGHTENYPNGEIGGFILNNGAYIDFWTANNAVAAFIDVNGAKGPNTFNKDIQLVSCLDPTDPSFYPSYTDALATDQYIKNFSNSRDWLYSKSN